MTRPQKDNRPDRIALVSGTGSSSKEYVDEGEEEETAREPRRTVVYRGDEALRQSIKAFSNAKHYFSAVSDSTAPSLGVKVDAYRNAYLDMMRRGVKVRAITEITKENVHYCKDLLDFGIVSELRHMDGVRGNFVVTDSEYLAASTIKEATPAAQVICSNDPEVVAQNLFVFETLWSKAVPAREKIRELEEGLTPQRTEVVTGEENVLELQLRMNANTRERTDACIDASAPAIALSVQPIRLAIIESISRGVRHRYVTEITRENLNHCKELMKLGVELRHLGGLKGNFALSEKEYIASSTVEGGKPIPQMIYSNRTEVVEQQEYLFQTLWNQAINAEARIREIEEGREAEETRLVGDASELYRLGERAIDECKEELLMVLASESTIHRNRKMFEKIIEAQAARGFKIRVLAPDSATKSSQSENALGRAEWRSISRTAELTIMVFDRRRMFITEYVDLDADTLQKAILSNIYTTNRQTIAGVASFFEALWSESELRAREEKTRKQAELLQDILTHDLRNYNQIARLSAELLQGSASNDVELQFHLASNILAAIDGSTSLIEKAKKVGRILAEQNPKLIAVDLLKVIPSSLQLVRAANPNSKVIDSLIVVHPEAGEDRGGCLVLADDFLGEVFDNVYSNSVRYAEEEASEVFIETRIELVESSGNSNNDNDNDEADDDGDEGDLRRGSGSRKKYWKVSIADHGRGISDDMKEKLFERYLRGARGSGLGMSIIHALVVERYKGRVKVRDRVEGDHTKGAIVEVLLAKA